MADARSIRDRCIPIGSLIGPWDDHSAKVGRGNNVSEGRLKKCCLNRRHRLAAILTVVPIWCARHRVATSHRLLGRSHGQTVKAVCRKGHDRDDNRDCFGKAHYRQNRPTRGTSQCLLAASVLQAERSAIGKLTSDLPVI
jgi:hypothetical protein